MGEKELLNCAVGIFKNIANILNQINNKRMSDKKSSALLLAALAMGGNSFMAHGMGEELSINNVIIPPPSNQD
jgi:hypothetical protein